MRNSFLALLVLVVSSAHAQANKQTIKAVLKIFSESMDYCNAITGIPSDRDTGFLVVQYTQFSEKTHNIYADADSNDKRLILYYTTIFQFRMGHIFTIRQLYREAYENYYRYADTGMEYLLQPNWFPLKYELEEGPYTVSSNYANAILPLFYNDMLSITLSIDNWQVAKRFYRKSIDLVSNTAYRKYMASNMMAAAMMGRNEDKDELLDYYLENTRWIVKLDTASQKIVAQYKYPDYDSRFKDILDLLPQLKPASRPGKYATVAALYSELKDSAKAGLFYNMALSAGPQSIPHLENAADISIVTFDKTLGLKAVEMLREYPGIDQDCNALSRILRVYERFGYKAEAITYQNKLDKCGK